MIGGMSDPDCPTSQTYYLSEPHRFSTAAVFSSPHSGAEYPSDLVKRSHLTPKQLRSSEDAFVDQLFGAAPGCGAPLISARYPRAWIDLNRAPDEIDPALVAGAPRAPRSPRINAGLGVIPRVVSESRVIMHGKIAMSEAERRITACYHPYHMRLRALLDRAHAMAGMAVLFDCHSMPHDALLGAPRVRGATPEIVLGDRFGASCDRWLIDAALELFVSAGFRVARNTPFAGGYITQAYGRPSRGFHAIQIEIDRSIYMIEGEIEKRPDFANVQRQISDIVRKLCQIGAMPVSVAAE